VRRREHPSAAAAPGTPPVAALVGCDLNSVREERQVVIGKSGDRSLHAKDGQPLFESEPVLKGTLIHAEPF
jgi:hypothetical protein